MLYLTLDENNYLLSVASVGGGIEANIDLSEFDLTGIRIRAHKWENDTLIFDADRYAELLEEETAETSAAEERPAGGSVYDELAAAYKEGVQEA